MLATMEVYLVLAALVRQGAAVTAATVQLQLADMPDCPMRTQLVGLEPSDQARALATLTTIGQPDIWHDSTYQISHDGGVVAVDPPAPPPRQRSQRHARTRRQSLYTDYLVDMYNVPQLHSKPGSANSMLLNFNGEIITASRWNEQWRSPHSVQIDGGGYTPITVQPFFGADKTAGPHAHSNTQRDAIVDIWMRVSEDFRVFNIDVTTVPPVCCEFARDIILAHFLHPVQSTVLVSCSMLID
jgi:hypothetical protein